MNDSFEAQELQKAGCSILEITEAHIEIVLPDGRQYRHWIRSGWNTNRKGSMAGQRGMKWLMQEAKTNRGVTKREKRRRRRFKLRLRTRAWIFWLIWAIATGMLAGWQLRGIWQ